MNTFGWMAKDSDGSWWWYEGKPEMMNDNEWGCSRGYPDYSKIGRIKSQLNWASWQESCILLTWEVILPDRYFSKEEQDTWEWAR